MTTVFEAASYSSGGFSLCIAVSVTCVMDPGGSTLHLEPGTITSAVYDVDNNRWSNVPFDVDKCNVSHALRQQKLSSPTLPTSEDCQGGILFSNVGTVASGYAHTVVYVTGVGVGDGGGGGYTS